MLVRTFLEECLTPATKQGKRADRLAGNAGQPITSGLRLGRNIEELESLPAGT